MVIPLNPDEAKRKLLADAGLISQSSQDILPLDFFKPKGGSSVKSSSDKPKVKATETVDLAETATGASQVIKNEQGKITGLTRPGRQSLVGIGGKEARALLGLEEQRTGMARGDVAANIARNRALLEAGGELSQVMQPLEKPQLEQLDVELSPAKSLYGNYVGSIVDVLATNHPLLSPVPRGLRTLAEDITFLRMTPEERANELRRRHTRNVMAKAAKVNILGKSAEAVPIAGSLVSGYSAGIGAPTGEIYDIVGDIEKLEETSNDIAGGAASNELNQLEVIKQIQDNIEAAEAYETRLRALVYVSTTLQVNPSKLDAIELRILKSKREMVRARNEAAIARIEREPSEAQMMHAIAEFNKGTKR